MSKTTKKPKMVFILEGTLLVKYSEFFNKTTQFSSRNENNLTVCVVWILIVRKVKINVHICFISGGGGYETLIKKNNKVSIITFLYIIDTNADSFFFAYGLWLFGGGSQRFCLSYFYARHPIYLWPDLGQIDKNVIRFKLCWKTKSSW